MRESKKGRERERDGRDGRDGREVIGEVRSRERRAFSLSPPDMHPVGSRPCHLGTCKPPLHRNYFSGAPVPMRKEVAPLLCPLLFMSARISGKMVD